jgi:ribonucleotide monophosphatase NagD (HAD superfamily)
VIGALEGCSKHKLELVFGKPSPLIVEAAHRQLNLETSECMIVGDSLESDISMGQQAGIATALVLTGVTRREDLASTPIQPSYIIESIAELPGLLDST